MTEIFNQPVIVEGWYWTLQSKKVKKGKAYPFSLMGRELVIYRGKGGEVACLDAYCPHMGAHLAEGRVEGNELRCFFHNWRFNNKGHCTDIPCLKKAIERVCVRSFKAEEKYGLIWVWTGRGVPDHLIPTPPELEELPYAYKLGNFFQKNCHPKG